jgi:hypothetical protein
VTERHAVWLVTPEQRAVLDRVEGRGVRYRLAWLRAPVRMTNGQRFEWVLAFLARPGMVGRLNRAPLLVDGRAVRVADLDQGRARLLTGGFAETDGLELVDVAAEPSWSDLDR